MKLKWVTSQGTIEVNFFFLFSISIVFLESFWSQTYLSFFYSIAGKSHLTIEVKIELHLTIKVKPESHLPKEDRSESYLITDIKSEPHLTIYKSILKSHSTKDVRSESHLTQELKPESHYNSTHQKILHFPTILEGPFSPPNQASRGLSGSRRDSVLSLSSGSVDLSFAATLAAAVNSRASSPIGGFLGMVGEVLQCGLSGLFFWIYGMPWRLFIHVGKDSLVSKM